jgi:hypothetical protein
LLRARACKACYTTVMVAATTTAQIHPSVVAKDAVAVAAAPDLVGALLALDGGWGVVADGAALGAKFCGADAAAVGLAAAAAATGADAGGSIGAAGLATTGADVVELVSISGSAADSASVRVK